MDTAAPVIRKWLIWKVAVTAVLLYFFHPDVDDASPTFLSFPVEFYVFSGWLFAISIFTSIGYLSWIVLERRGVLPIFPQIWYVLMFILAIVSLLLARDSRFSIWIMSFLVNTFCDFLMLLL
jgi:hypothetical protein